MMAKLLSDKSQVTRWVAYFEDHHKGDIETIAANYPNCHSITIDYTSLDEKTTSDLLSQPYKAIFNAEQALKSFDTVHGHLDIKLHIKNMDAFFPCIPPNRLRAQHLGQFISVDGFIRKTTSVRPKLEIAAFRCQKCNAIIHIEQNEKTVTEPSECYEEQGGCGRLSTFQLMDNLSKTTDHQKILLQEPPEDIKQGEQAEKLTAYLEDDLVHIVVPGDRVIFTGILRMQPKRVSNRISTVYDTFLDVNNVQVKHTAYSSMNLSDDDKKEIKKLAKSANIVENIYGSIAPSIFGYEDIKKAIMLQLFGSDNIIHSDGTFRRGDIHILLMGDPGIAKSVILESAHLISPRAIFIEGPLASGAGLTAVAVKDDFGDGQWTIEAGALPQADQGLAVIDEFEKMDVEDRDKIHRAMEQQKVTVTKAGLNVTLNARCAILAAANPKFGSFDMMEPLMAQVDLPPTILSRFDTLFVMVDKVNAQADIELGKRIVHAHVDSESTAPPFSVELLKKYILYAKTNSHPTLTDSLGDQIAGFYSDLRKKLDDDDTGESITPRQIESVIRFSKAKARLHLRSEVSSEDVKYAIRVLESAYNTRLRDSAGLNYELERVVDMEK
jgi:replicative DNA helicase Mcm